MRPIDPNPHPRPSPAGEGKCAARTSTLSRREGERRDPSPHPSPVRDGDGGDSARTGREARMRGPGKCALEQPRIFQTPSRAACRCRRAIEALPVVLVAAVALVDIDGRVLVQQRPAHKSWAGWWEFPGGKVHEGETPEATVVRELRRNWGSTSPRAASHRSPLLPTPMTISIC